VEVKVRVFDFDGVLTRSRRYNPDIKLPWWLFLWLIFVMPNKKMIKILRNLDRRDIVIIISARPEELKIWMKIWLKIWFRFLKIPDRNLFCVGLGKDAKKRKLRVIERVIKQMKMKVEEVIDDDQPTVEYLKEHGINARVP